MKNKLMILTSAIALTAMTGLASAETVTLSTTADGDTMVKTSSEVKTTTTTSINQTAIDGATSFQITTFDLNNDNLYSKDEIGEKLFYIYDTDGNEIIDNIEFDSKRVITVVPIEKETYTMVDFGNDGDAEQTSYTFTRVMADTGLAVYDDNKDGLSAAEFSGTFFLKADKNKDNAIDLDEWQSLYLSTVAGISETEKFN